MIRTTTHISSVTAAGRIVTLTERHTRATFTVGPAALALLYRRPTSVAVGARRIAIKDHVGLVRATALVAVLVATLVGRSR